MENKLIYPVGTTRAVACAVKFLPYQTVDHPTPEVTHLLLDVPSFRGGALRGGGDVEKILEMLPPEITVIGGNLDHPALEGYRKLDLLKDPEYAARNGAITAHCAIRLALPCLDITLDGCPVLIIGWGRIGKCLARLLGSLGADVTVAARKETDRAMLRALGYRAVDTVGLKAKGYRLLYNTVPEKILSEQADCTAIELASGVFLPGENVIDGRGLPGRFAPESSGRLMAETIVRRI